MKWRLFITFFLSAVILHAQPGMGTDPNEGIPITGGILYLLGAALTYGIFAFNKTRKKNSL